MKTDTDYEPLALRPWTLPACYCGEVWPDYYVFLSQSRDSDALTRSNFRCALAAIGGEAEAEDSTPLVVVVRESHWACGWVEWIAVHGSATEALRKADAIALALENYPVVDEDDFSELENEEAAAVWRDCYTPAARAAYARKHGLSRESRDWADLRAAIRGDWFPGEAGALLS